MLKFFFAFIFFFFGSEVFASDILVLDKHTAPGGAPKHFRSSNQALPADSKVDSTGLKEVHELGSAQFTQQWFSTALPQLPHPLVVVDLRQESHAFVNGHPFTWFAKRDWGNAGLTSQEASILLQKQIVALRAQSAVTMATHFEKQPSGNIITLKQHTFANPVFTTEEVFLKQLSVPYMRIFVTDHIPPEEAAIDQFVGFARHLPPQEWIYFHCRAGVGRTTTFMAMYDMLKNAHKVSLNDILKRQNLIGGKDLTKPPSELSYKRVYAVKRLKFLECFYQYSHDNYANHFIVPWSAWLIDARKKYPTCIGL